MRKLLFACAASVALLAGAPAFADSVHSGGDSSATATVSDQNANLNINNNTNANDNTNTATSSATGGAATSTATGGAAHSDSHANAQNFNYSPSSASAYSVGVGGEGGRSAASVGNTSATGGSATGGNAVATSAPSTSASNSGGNSMTTTVTENHPRQPVNTAYAAPLNFSSDTCYASATAGGQGVGFGASLGFPFKDKACERRANARTLQLLGEREAAVLYLSAGDPEINSAVTLARSRTPAGK